MTCWFTTGSRTSSAFETQTNPCWQAVVGAHDPHSTYLLQAYDERQLGRLLQDEEESHPQVVALTTSGSDLHTFRKWPGTSQTKVDDEEENHSQVVALTPSGSDREQVKHK